MHLSRKWLGIVAAALPILQATSIVSAAQTIFFTDPDSAAPVSNQLISGSGANKGSFSPAAVNNNVLDVTGSNGVYIPGYVTGINSGAGDASNYLNIGGFSPTSDNIFIGLKLDNNGTPIDPGSIAQIIGDINTDNSATYGTNIASTIGPGFAGVFPNYDIMLSLPETYTNAVTVGSGSNGQFAFSFDFSNYSDDSGAITVTDIAVVPEPASLGLIGAATLILALPRYRRRRA